jgi:ParB family transcriptional regulator, chromosome partitioning protein
MSKLPDNPRRALGRGLSALIPTRTPAISHTPEPPHNGAESIAHLLIEKIDPNPLQPRRVFQTERLQELAQSIRSNGIIQPLVVRRTGDRYQLIAGERRWRAAKLAGLAEVPAIVQQFPDDRLLEITLIENIQREDLNPIETAIAFERLAKELALSHEEIGTRTGKDRTTITNLLRLLNLPADLQQLVGERRLSPGHARCLLGLPTAALQREVAEKSIAQGWSVRQMERMTQRMMETRQPKHIDEVEPDPNVKAAIQEMERALGTKVRIVEKAKQRGRIEIEYYSPEDLDRIYSAIVGPAD